MAGLWNLGQNFDINQRTLMDLFIFVVLIVLGYVCFILYFKSDSYVSPEDRIQKMHAELDIRSTKLDERENRLADEEALLIKRTAKEMQRISDMHAKLSQDESYIRTEIQMYNQAREHYYLKTKVLKETYNNKFQELDRLLEQYQSTVSSLESQKVTLDHMLSSKEVAFSYMARLMADYQLTQYDISADTLENKSRPAKIEALRIRELKKKTKEYLIQKNLLQYRLDDLLSLFPDLDSYVEEADDVPIESRSSHLLSDEEWIGLNVSERNQLILDNYIKGRKSKWQIGRDYELYVGYRYSLQGYSVDYYGSNHGIEDLGRDLIIFKNGEVGIVQCKYWSSKKLIHEKHIAQLYGTVVSYIIEHQYIPELVHGIFITNIKLSPTAKKFADYLGIKYKEEYPIGDFPRIKCNIGKDESGSATKIYHLPTDQQYDSVRICQPGECFAFTIEEAERNGFRHAYKWHSS